MRKINLKLSFATLLLLVTVAILLSGCQKQKFRIDVLDAQMFDLSDEFDKFSSDARGGTSIQMIKTHEGNNHTIYTNPLHGINYFGYEKFGIQVKLNLYYTAADESVWFYDSDGKKERKSVWNYRLQQCLERGISINGTKYEIYEKEEISSANHKPAIKPYVDIDDWDKGKRTVNCTIYAVVNMNLLENFNLTLNRKDMTKSSWNDKRYAQETEDYVQKITFSRENLHIPDYSNMDNFISSIDGDTVKRSFKAYSVKNLFMNFKPSNPQKGNYILVYDGLDFLYAKTFENGRLKCAVDVNQAQILIYVSYNSSIDKNMGYYRNGVFQHYGIAASLMVSVTDLIKEREVFKKTYSTFVGLPIAGSIAQEISETIN
ncbi:MAG: hypothetical protein LBT27_06495 [Prevotellaceae bacterium]|jgi:hypothetical protein|nr:hypothetical protein [Prevotellaceae bacterium]